MSVLKKQSSSLISNLFWKFAERFSAQLISTVVSIILARILMPEDYGIVAIVTIFINLANVFVSDGLGSALIQKKNATELDFFSVLYFNLAFSIILYIGLYLLAPWITAFYGSGYQILTPVLRVLGLRVILTSINSVQQAYVSKKMIFKKFFVSTFWGTIISAVVGITMACCRFGVWALVAQYLTGTTISTFVLAIVLKKRPRLLFSFASVKELLPYGIYILGTGLLITGYQDLRALIIGKVYDATSLAYYDKAKHFPSLLVTNINTSIGAVLFPKMSNDQEDTKKIKEHTRNSIRFSSYIISPMMLGLAAIAEPMIRLLLTEKWSGCVPLLQLFCIVYLFQPIHTANMQAIKAIGEGKTYMRLEVVKKIMELIVLFITIPFGVTAITIGMVVCATLSIFINTYPNIKFLNYSFKEQMADILPNVLISGVMFILVYLLNNLLLEDAFLMIIQVIAGMVLYVLFSAITKNASFFKLLDMLKNSTSKNKNANIQ